MSRQWLLAVVLFFVVTDIVHAANVKLEWNAPLVNTDGSPLTDLKGYIVYWDKESRLAAGTYQNSKFVNNVNTAELSNLDNDKTYYVVVRAVDYSNNLSEPSNELEFKTSPDSDGDGVADNDDLDDDNDGLSDQEEAELGTDRLVADTDNDSVNDRQESLDGTDPLDHGSVLSRLGTTDCSEWNSYFGMYNYKEHVNLSNTRRMVTISLYSIAGILKDIRSFFVEAGAQYDFPVHEMLGYDPSSYGRVCSTHDGQPGDMDGRMVHYLLDQKTGGYQFAFSMANSNGKLGSQFMPFNTYQPSLDSADSQNLVANWIQITYLGKNEKEAGRLFFYDASGKPLGDEKGEYIEFSPGQRFDRSAHQFGANIVGMAEWRPDSNQSKFLVRNVRYLYDNQFGNNSFDAAFQLEASKGTGRVVAAPVDTRSGTAVVEILNTSAQAITANVKIHNSLTKEVKEFNLTESHLPAKGSYHLIVDGVLGANNTGVVTIESNQRNSLLAVVMQYKRNQTLGIDTMYGLRAEPSIGTVIKGSYNTYLGQKSRLVLVNSSSQDQVLGVSLTRSTGEVILNGLEVKSATKGFLELDIADYEQANQYGVLSIQSSKNSVSAWVLRERAEDYVIPTPVRE